MLETSGNPRRYKGKGGFFLELPEEQGPANTLILTSGFLTTREQTSVISSSLVSGSCYSSQEEVGTD